MDRYLSLRCDLPVRLEEELAEALTGLKVLGSMIEGRSGGIVSATIYLEASQAPQVGVLRRRLEELGAHAIVEASFEPSDWLAAYREQARPFSVGRRWWVEPRPEEAAPAPAGRIRLVVEPSTAFGTGSHASTQLVLLALERMPVAGSTVLDVGTGSGILALAAEELGASGVVAIDRDPEAVWVARRLERRCGRRSGVQFVVGTIEALGRAQFDRILCNMISSELTPLLAPLSRLLAPLGELVLSGILVGERRLIRDAVEAAGLEIHGKLRLGDWLAYRVGHG